MTPAWKEGQTVVSRLRVHARGLDPLSTRLRVESILGAARLHPAGLAPSALLIIRRFRDPLPGAFSLRRGPLRPPPAWERAAEEAIRDLARRAIRPALESNEVDTEAVLFADRAEFLACLARDWLDNRLESHWWWRSVSRATDRSRSVSDSWSSSPEFIPGALQHLAVRGRAASFVRAIPGDVARDLTCAMARAHGLDSVHSSISVRPETSGTASETRSEPLGPREPRLLNASSSNGAR